MIYQEIERKLGKSTDEAARQAAILFTEIVALQKEIEYEDSKRKEKELREQLKQKRRDRFELAQQIEAARIEVFKDLLAEEYGLPRSHPKFEAAFRLAWEHGHGSGFNDVELYFQDLVELVK